jgi:uncharacterized protein YjbI with pentapeptide repeats
VERPRSRKRQGRDWDNAVDECKMSCFPSGSKLLCAGQRASFTSMSSLISLRYRRGGANLRGADLSAANLTLADLSNADLSKAVLIDTNLIEADLSEANLTDADLTGAFLGQANFRGTLVTPEQLNKAKSPDDIP